MRTVGSRKLQELSSVPTGAALAAMARHNEAVAMFAPIAGVRRGVYRFASHAEANQFDAAVLAERMVTLARTRAVDERK